MDTKQIISIISDLPVEQQVEIASQVLQLLNDNNPNVEQAWMGEVERRWIPGKLN